MTQLTLDFDPGVVKQCEQLAAESGTTVSEVLARLVRERANQRLRTEPGPLTRQISGIVDLPADEQEHPDVKLGPLTRRASGIIDLPADADYRDIIADAMIDKYNSIK